MITFEQSTASRSLELLDSIGLALTEAYSDVNTHTNPRQAAHDEVLRTRPNLPSLAKGHLYRMTLREVGRYQVHNTRLNPHAVNTILAQR